MATLQKYNLTGKEVGKVIFDDEWLDVSIKSQMVKDYIVAIRENARQWSASTKDRGEVKHSTRKPHKQKGLGRARQGSTVSPQFRGGGVVFGPKPKFDQHVKINKKERRQAIKSLIADKIRDERVCILNDTTMESPRTHDVVAFLKSCDMEGKRVLFLGEGNYATVPDEERVVSVNVACEKHGNFAKSVRNISKVEFMLAKNISGYDIMIAHDIVMTETALEEIKEWLK